MYVPAYPLPIMEIGSFVASKTSNLEIEIISIPVDYGLPLTREGSEQIYRELLHDLAKMKPKGIGISCTAIAQAEEAIFLSGLIKENNPDVFLFLGGYFPTVYYEEIFSRTSAIDAIVIGEGEIPSLRIVECLEKGQDPRYENTPSLIWKKDGRIQSTKKAGLFKI